jgi:hypothetical protein
MPVVTWTVINAPSFANFWIGGFFDETSTELLSSPEGTPPGKAISEPLVFSQFVSDVGFWAFAVTDAIDPITQAETREYPADGTVQATDGAFVLDWNTGMPVSSASGNLLLIGGIVLGVLLVGGAVLSGSRR